ncbi:MAG: threonine ammonia-lyase, biosynthetic [Gammaproteobacteria bacterium]|nr:threonine ammonia-lyase, biosynthetic [Gammaproteobacteria bacterium]MCP5200673.1 threonine ammonia-lyase, biosynthetic [Gammaproteobacteria bacterium]
MLDNYVKMILRAPVYDVARETPLEEAPAISRRLGHRVWLKREDMQPVFSYKIRGAYTMMAALSADERGRGVITASAGNHAQGVALAARVLDCTATIVMPKTTPEIKVDSVRRLGAEIILHGNTYDEASAYAHKLEEKDGLTYVPPFDHPLVIAGQGTVAMEILRQHSRPLAAVFVPVGGGGLIAGIAAYVKALAPDIKVIGVEADEAASMTRALEVGERITLERIGIFADGAAVRQVGAEPFAIARRYVDEMLTVSIDEICAAVKDIFEDTRSIAEPAGALALAGLKQYTAREGGSGQEYVAILSGANVNFDRLRHIAELAELGEQREVLIGATIPERPGSFREFCHALGPRLITEFNYRYADSHSATVFAGVQVRDREHERRLLIDNLREKGYQPIDMTDDDVAKMHVRFMVGGHAGGVSDERLLRCEFPERPGALLLFLNHLGERWNISLFHYRNHGAAYGRVLMGIQVPPGEMVAFETLLQELDMRFEDETNNPAFRLFLS